MDRAGDKDKVQRGTMRAKRRGGVDCVAAETGDSARGELGAGREGGREGGSE